MARHRLRTANEGWLTSYADLITNLLIFFVLIISASQIQTGRMEKIIAEMSTRRSEENLTAAAEKLKKALAEQKLTEHVRVDLTDEGLELSFDSGVTFETGSAEVLPAMEQPLLQILQVLKPYSERYKLAVEGHTDERPIKTGIYKSNWELASARALIVRERLEQIGISPKKIRVESYADNKLLPAEVIKNLQRDAMLAKHRRVVIRLF